MVIADFQVEDKAGKSKFFQKIFLIANTKLEVILGILFLKLRNANMLYSEKTLYRGLTLLTRPY